MSDYGEPQPAPEAKTTGARLMATAKRSGPPDDNVTHVVIDGSTAALLVSSSHGVTHAHNAAQLITRSLDGLVELNDNRPEVMQIFAVPAGTTISTVPIEAMEQAGWIRQGTRVDDNPRDVTTGEAIDFDSDEHWVTEVRTAMGVGQVATLLEPEVSSWPVNAPDE